MRLTYRKRYTLTILACLLALLGWGFTAPLWPGEMGAWSIIYGAAFGPVVAVGWILLQNYWVKPARWCWTKNPEWLSDRFGRCVKVPGHTSVASSEWWARDVVKHRSMAGIEWKDGEY